jgi:hypothetical protein
LTYPGPFGPLWPVVGDLYLYILLCVIKILYISVFYFSFNNHIIKYNKINRIFTSQFNYETQSIFNYVVFFNTALG